MEVRKLKISDYEAAFSFWQSISMARRGMRTMDDSEEGIARFLERNPNTCFIAEENGGITGTILAGHDGRRGYIYHAAVDERYRRQGVGKALVNAAVKALKSERINKVALVAFKDNVNGNAFWENIGFTERNDLVYRNLSINDNNI